MATIISVEGDEMAEIINALSRIISGNRASGYVHFSATQYDQTIYDAALSQTVGQFNAAAREVVQLEQKAPAK